MVDSSGLENRYSSKHRTIEGSNPSLSFDSMNGFVYFIGFAWIGLEGEMARLYHPLAEPEQ